MIMEYFYELLHQNSVCLLEILEWLIDVNLAITYLLTNFYIKKNSQKYCNLCLITTYSNILGNKIDICETCIS